MLPLLFVLYPQPAADLEARTLRIDPTRALPTRHHRGGQERREGGRDDGRTG